MKGCALILFAALCLSLSASSCLNGSNFTRQPDQILFDRATEALEEGRIDVAEVEFVTLINTYPTSEYASEAASILEDDPRLSCDGRHDTYFFVGPPPRCAK